MKHFDAQEIKVSPSKHLSFEIFQTIDVALYDSVAPGQGKSRKHGSIIARDAQSKALKFRNLGDFCPTRASREAAPLDALSASA